MRIFISGPVSGYPDSNFPAFRTAELAVALAGYEPVSIRAIVQTELAGVLTLPHRTYMEVALRHLLTCDAIHMLSGWGASVGATCEVAVALTLRLPFVTTNGKIIPSPERVCISSQEL